MFLSVHLCTTVILLEQRRCVVLPNILQHCVQPFELLDKAQTGHRKILVFFLDPNNEVLSTSLAPPQVRWTSDIIHTLTSTKADWVQDTLAEALVSVLPKQLGFLVADCTSCSLFGHGMPQTYA